MVEQTATSRPPEAGRATATGADPNVGRGPWCIICGLEMNHPNHRFHGQIADDGSLVVRRFRGHLLKGYETLCGEVCLQHYVAQWAGMAGPKPPRSDRGGVAHATGHP